MTKLNRITNLTINYWDTIRAECVIALENEYDPMLANAIKLIDEGLEPREFCGPQLDALKRFPKIYDKFNFSDNDERGYLGSWLGGIMPKRGSVYEVGLSVTEYNRRKAVEKAETAMRSAREQFIEKQSDKALDESEKGN